MSLRAIALGLSLLFLGTGCDRPKTEQEEAPVVGPQSAKGEARERFSLARSDQNALFVWVEANGEFKTTNQAAAIPEGSRKVVRVIHPEHPSTPSAVWVSDLARDSEVLEVVTLPRTEWESKGEKDRAARLEAARPKELAPDGAQLAGVSAVLYGASWCHACKAAESYLKGKGVALTKKDIEEDAGAQAEMTAKLRRAGQGGSSIPVIDIAGTVLVGFSEGAVNAALARALKK